MVVVVICIYIYIYISVYIGTLRLSYYSCYFLSCIYIAWCIQLIIYCMVERWEWYKHVASLLFPFLLLLIDLYDCAGTYNATIIEDRYVDDDDVPVPILSHNDNYYTFIPSSYVVIGGAGDIYMYIYQ